MLVIGVALLALSGTVRVEAEDRQTFRGWGLFPAGYDRQTPTYADGSLAVADATWLPAKGDVPEKLHRTVCDLGFEIGRVYFTPTLSPAEGKLDRARMQDLKDHLSILRKCGVAKTVVTNWSPPAYMKTPDRVRYGKYKDRVQTLDPAYADGKGYDYADFVLDVLKELRRSGFAPPLAFSIQNEPDVAQIYDSNVMVADEGQRRVYREVVKQLRRKLDANGFRGVQLVGAEDAGYEGLTKILGEPSPAGFAALEADREFRDALGGFAFHTYYTSGRIAAINQAREKYPSKPGWMTEYCGNDGVRGELRPKSGNDQLDWTLNFVRRMGADLIDLKSDYWFFWRGWRPLVGPGDQDLVYQDSQKTKAYHVFQRLWTTVKGGWRVKRVSADAALGLRTDNAALIASGSGDQWSAPVDIVAFESPDRRRTCVVLANATAAAKEVASLSGLKGRRATVYVTTTTQDMAAQPVRDVSGGTLAGGTVSLPANSVTLVVTAGS
jgi:O-glycosyl hydrolase